MRVYMCTNLRRASVLLVSLAIMFIPQVQGYQGAILKAKQFQKGKTEGKSNDIGRRDQKANTKAKNRIDDDKVDSNTTEGNDRVYRQTSSGDGNINVPIIIPGTGNANVYIEYHQAVNSIQKDKGPTELEMKEALIQAMSRQGIRIDQNTVVVDVLLFGISAGLEIIEFEKLGCQTDNDGGGYIGYYRVVSRLVVYSNNGTREEIELPEAYKPYLRIFMGGKDTFDSIGKLRFFRSKSGWLATNN